MLDISDIRLGTVVKIANEPYVVTWTQHVQMGRGGAILRLKLKNLINGAVLEKTLKGADRLDEAELEREKATFLYKQDDEFYFMSTSDYEQFTLPTDSLNELTHFVKEGTDVEVLKFENKPVSVHLPIKIELKVVEAPPGIKGDTAGTATKPVTLETGYQVNVPLFIKEGDILRINTQSGEYLERVN